jgi:small subunit ribosomal protein S17
MSERSNKRTIKAVVVSNKRDKTIVVRSQRLVKHSVFHKYVRNYVKFKAHDEKNECNVGDKVLIIESRPLSREKRWRMVEVLEKAK